MDTSDWINLIAAILVGGGTFFLGIMAWRTIRQTRSIQKAEKKERLLNEIIEWGQFLASWPESKISQGLTSRYPIEGNVYTIIYGRIGKQIDDVLTVNGRNLYIIKLSKIFNAEFRNVITNTINHIDNYKEYLIQWKTELQGEVDKGTIGIKIEDNYLSKISNIDTYISNLIVNAEKVIEEATKIKTRDIS